MDAPKVALTDIPFEINVTDSSSLDFCNYSLELNDVSYRAEDCSDVDQIVFSNLVLSKKATYTAQLSMDGQVLSSKKIEVVWGWVSILPPLIAIIIALLFRSVIPALFFGIWIGSFAILGFNFKVIWQSFLDVIATYVKSALVNADHAAIIIFSLMIGGLVGVISKKWWDAWSGEFLTEIHKQSKTRPSDYGNIGIGNIFRRLRQYPRGWEYHEKNYRQT